MKQIVIFVVLVISLIFCGMVVAGEIGEKCGKPNRYHHRVVEMLHGDGSIDYQVEVCFDFSIYKPGSGRIVKAGYEWGPYFPNAFKEKDQAIKQWEFLEEKRIEHEKQQERARIRAIIIKKVQIK